MSRVLVIGDVMLDEYVECEATRLSPEAPVPVLREINTSTSVGGAANVAAGIAALGVHTQVIGVVGHGDEGDELLQEIANATSDGWCGLAIYGRHTTRKRRLISGGQQIARVDRESTNSLSAEDEDKIVKRATDILTIDEYTKHRVGAIVISDYAKGVITHALCRAVIETAGSRPVIVDPKCDDWSMYRGAWLITPNEHEANSACGGRWIAPSIVSLMSSHKIQNCLITRGANGATLFTSYGRSCSVYDFPAQRVDVVDVTGAGDTVVATIAACISCVSSPQTHLRKAIEIAMRAAAITVSRRGTHVVSSEDFTRIEQDVMKTHQEQDHP